MAAESLSATLGSGSTLDSGGALDTGSALGSGALGSGALGSGALGSSALGSGSADLDTDASDDAAVSDLDAEASRLVWLSRSGRKRPAPAQR
jgi:hypothetical protein